MPRGMDYEDDEDIDPEDDEEYGEDLYGEEEPEDDDDDDYSGRKTNGAATKRRRSHFVDDVAEEDDDEDEEEGEMYGRGSRHKKIRGGGFIDDMADVDDLDEEEEEEDAEDDFIVHSNTADNVDEDRRMHRRPLLPREEQEEDVEDLERRIQERYARSSQAEYDEETTDVEQQALLPSVRDPKLWMVKCAIGREREVAVCLMQKCIDKGSELQIRAAVALDHLKNYIYIEADKEAHVREAIKGMRNIFPSKITLVPIKEMTDVLSVESKAIDLSRDTWVRMKTGTYKGDLAKILDVDNVRQRVTVKLIPRIDLQALTNRLWTKS